jgi:PIN domain nuclease of toxin-antitoxin system
MVRRAMNNLVLDTHVWIWLAEGNPRLPLEVRSRIEETAIESWVYISAISPWEIGLLVAEKKLNLGSDVQAWVDRALGLQGVRLTPLSPKVAVDSTRLPFEIHTDPADRILVATARHLGATLVTADRLLLQHGERGYFSCLAAS